MPSLLPIALLATASLASTATLPGVYSVQDYGILPNGSDASAQFARLLTTVYTAGGGTIYFPPETADHRYRLDACFQIPNDGAIPIPAQPPIRLTGGGSSPNHPESGGDLPYGGSVVDSRCPFGTAVFDTRGKGLLEIDHLSFVNGGNADVPYIQTTNTVLKVHDNFFTGRAINIFQSNLQDAILLGGTSRVQGGGSSAPFQGYLSTIENNAFNHIRRGVHVRAYGNGVVIRENDWGYLCGADSSAGAIEISGSGFGGVAAQGVVVMNNIFEMTGYVYGVRVTNGLSATITGNGFYDAASSSKAAVYFGPGSTGNVLIHGIAGTIGTLDESGGANVVVEAGPNGFQVSSDATVNAASGDATLSTALAGKRTWSLYNRASDNAMGLYDWRAGKFRMMFSAPSGAPAFEGLSGRGNAVACIDPNGRITRSASVTGCLSGKLF
jgi:hypothetical protein